jgi:hypothetical protein
VARLDDRLHEELEHAARPADPSGLYEDLIRRRERRRVMRRVQAGALALVVVVGTVAGLIGLSRVFGNGETAPPLRPAQPGPMQNGLVAYTTGDAIAIQAVDGSDARTIPAPAPGLARHLAWSPEGRRLAVAVFGDPGRSLWVVRDDGQDPVRIAEGDNVSRPSWHPDGRHLTYSLTTDGTTEVHVTRSDGTGDRVVYSEAAQGTYAIFSATFSPDGTQIVFDAGTDSGYDIFVMDADGSNVRQITRTGTDYNPAWSPNGSTIVFTRQEDASESDIFAMRSDGSDVRRLTDDGARSTNLEPQYSPDGRLITYMAAVNGATGPILVMDRDGSDPCPLVTADLLGFSWQPVPVEPAPTGPTSTPTPPSGTPSPGTEPTEPLRLAGVPFAVCDVREMPWRYSAEGIGAVYVFEEAPTDGCGAAEGFQYVGITRNPGEEDPKVQDFFGPLERCTDATGCWPYAALELDGDDPDEILLGTSGGSWGLEVWFIDVAPEGDELVVRPFAAVCSDVADCDPYVIVSLDWTPPDLRGFACGRYPGDGSFEGSGYFEWESVDGDGWGEWEYGFEDGTVRVLPVRGLVSQGDPLAEFPPSDDAQICLQPAFVPEGALVDP